MTIDAVPPSYKDRRGWLIFFGLLQLALGVLALLMTALMSFSFFIAAPARATTPFPARAMVPIVGMYLAVAAWFIVVGVGSMLPRRWAWALTLVVSWIWLAFGVLTGAVMLTIGSSVFPEMPAGQESVRMFVLGCMAVGMGFFFLLLPIAFVLFYRGPNVKATVWARDPVRRWTDSIPLPVLGFGLLLLTSAAMFPMASGSYKALPLGGTLVRGWAAAAIVVAVSALCLFCGIQMLRLRRSGWWATLIVVLLGVVYGAIFTTTDVATWRQVIAFDIPPKDFERIVGMYHGPLFLGWMVVGWGAYVGFLLYVRRYFFPRVSGPDAREIPAS